jgi:hypothetical protein
MRIPFLRKRIDWSDPQQLRRHATYLPATEGAWPIRGNGELPSSEELMADLERVRRLRATAYPEDTG